MNDGKSGAALTRIERSAASLSKPTVEGLEAVLIEGNLSRLTPDQRITYYQRVCESTGLNPLTQPFEYLTLQGKMILYARRACTDQLRKIHSVSVSIVSRERMDGVYVVTARAQMPDGRADESVGAVPIDNLKGEALANALMKAETKAKRRVTLAICGLSMLDESEVEGARATERPARANGKPARTLDDVAGPEADERPFSTQDGPAMTSSSSSSGGAQASEPIDAEFDEQTGDIGQLDEYGLTIPQSPCPVFPKGKANAGKRWDEVPTPLIEKMYAEHGERMSTPQTEWATYLMTKRQKRKAAEAAAQADTKSEGEG
jgi:hypothetical protein